MWRSTKRGSHPNGDSELVASRVRQTFAATTRKQPSLKLMEVDVAHLRRVTNWLVGEAEVHRWKVGKRATSRQRHNILRLRVERCSLRELELSVETKKACLRDRVTQLRRLRAAATSFATNTAYHRQGSSCLNGGARGGRNGFKTHLQTRFLTSERARLVRREDRNLSDSTLLDWASTRSEAPVQSVEEPIDDKSGGTLLRNLTAGKPLGVKKFHQATGRLCGTCWRVILKA